MVSDGKRKFTLLNLALEEMAGRKWMSGLEADRAEAQHISLTINQSTISYLCLFNVESDRLDDYLIPFLASESVKFGIIELCAYCSV